MITRSRRRSRKRRARNASYTPLINPVRRKRRKARRRNAWFNNSAGHRKAALRGWRMKRRKSRRKNPGRRQAYLINPGLTIRHGKNPRRRRAHRSNRRRNPMRGIRQAFSRQWIMKSLTIGGGIAGGMFTMPLVNKMVPADMKIQVRPFLGLVNVLLGSLMATMVKNRHVKEIGMIIAGTGVYDLIAYNVKDLGLPTLPESNIILDKFLPVTSAPMSASYNVARAPVSRVAAAGIASSYEAPGARTVGLSGTRFASENPYAEVFN